MPRQINSAHVHGRIGTTVWAWQVWGVFLRCPSGASHERGRVGEPDLTDDGVLPVAAVDDLMATKVSVVLQRAEAKDHRDIAEIVRAASVCEKGSRQRDYYSTPVSNPARA